MSNPTTSIEVRRWEDKPEEGRSADDWPYPDVHVEYRIDGHLADLIRARTKEEGVVLFEEIEASGGWSEYTQETDYWVTVRVGKFEREFDGAATDNHYRSALPAIQRWLGGTDA